MILCIKNSLLSDEEPSNLFIETALLYTQQINNGPTQHLPTQLVETRERVRVKGVAGRSPYKIRRKPVKTQCFPRKQ